MNRWALAVVLAYIAIFGVGLTRTRPVVPVVERATAAVYVFEKDATPVPVGVTAGLNRVNREKGIVATLLEADTINGGGAVPQQYQPALAAAKAKGLPSLVVLSGTAVLSVVKSPADADAIVRAVP